MKKLTTAVDVGQLKQGDIIKLDLDPTVGHEQQDFRPCVVLSVAPWNKAIRGFAFVVPLTNKAHPNPNAEYPALSPEQTDCGIQGTALLDQIRSLDAIGRNGRLVGCVTDQQFIDDLRMAICLIMGVDKSFFAGEES